ncbi:hypothetical protein IX38_11430 [Chryseobacterium luteum]|uniref:Uncharacterized protein n=1 Tax=Chryseobacterium luteum TaxID=421531 RepID=A0A085ZHT1_9FLAO|nr:hypothetical protein IX38_11430 [Chryseobacterium luteum]
MKNEVLLLDAKNYDTGCAVYVLIGSSAILTNVSFIFMGMVNLNIHLFIIFMIVILGWVINENRIYKNKNRKYVLSVS